MGIAQHGLPVQPPGLIKCEQAFTSHSLPSELVNRKKEVEIVTEAITPLVQGLSPINLFIYGATGSGKTTCVKFVLNQIKTQYPTLLTVYANCWRYSTRMAIYSLIANALGEPLPRRGLAIDEVFTRIAEVIDKTNQKLVIVLDNIDGLFANGQEKLLLDLSYLDKNNALCVICISNREKTLQQIETESKNHLRLAKVEFKPFNHNEMEEILIKRTENNIAIESIEDGVISICSAKAAATGNARIGLELLWKAAKNAERQGRNKILIQDVEAAEHALNYEPRQVTDKSVSEEEQIILDILKTGEKTSTEIYVLYNDKLKRSKRQIRNYLRSLATKELITMTQATTNNWLNGKMIKLKN